MRRTIEELQARLDEAEELLRAIRSGEVDALVVSGATGDQVYTLKGAEHPYRVMVETMSEGALILAGDGTIVYSNQSFAAMLDTPLEQVVGLALDHFVLTEDLPRYGALILERGTATSKGEIRITSGAGRAVPVHMSISPFGPDEPGGTCIVVIDLTEQKRHQELINAEVRRRSEANLTEAQRIGHVGSWEWNVATGECRWSLEHFRLFGVDPESFLPTKDNTQRLIHPDDFTRVENTLQEAIRGNTGFEVAYRIVRPDGSIRHHRGLGHPLISETGDPTFVGMVIDLTDLKEAEQALRVSEERFRRYFELGLIGMAITSPSKGYVEVNDELCRMLGYEREELLRMTWAEMTHPDDLASDVAQFDRVMSREINGYSIDKRWIRKDGRTVYSIMAAQGVPRPDGSVDYFVKLVQDITERKIAEERLRRSEALLAQGQEMTRTGSWVLIPSTGELSWSLEHYRLWGVDPATFTLTLTTARDLIHPEDRDEANNAFDVAVREQACFEREFRIVRPDGRVRQMFSVGRPVLNDSGEYVEYVGTVMDITDRKTQEAAREELRLCLVEAQEEERRRIALEMHDQFGQQLSAITLALSALKRESGRRTRLNKQLASLEAIARELDHDLELIVSRLRPPALDDLGLVAALTYYVKRWSEHFGIRAELHATGEPGRLNDDIDITLYRIAQEALNNIAKHARATHVAIIVDRHSDRASLIVEDDGVGFDVEQSMRPYKGFGIVGMRERAMLLRGTLDIESGPGRGTTVVARVPRPATPKVNTK